MTTYRKARQIAYGILANGGDTTEAAATVLALLEEEAATQRKWRVMSDWAEAAATRFRRMTAEQIAFEMLHSVRDDLGL